MVAPMFQPASRMGGAQPPWRSPVAPFTILGFGVRIERDAEHVEGRRTLDTPRRVSAVQSSYRLIGSPVRKFTFPEMKTSASTIDA